MLLLARQMHGASVEASDGKIGKLCDLLFDEQDWSIRYLVMDGGTWLNRRRVTLPPDLVRRRDWADHRLSVAGLTRRQVMESPNVETHVPLGQPTKEEEATIVNWEIYWIHTMDHPWQVSDDPHVRSTQETTEYYIQGSDGPLGHVADFLIDDEAWTIRYLALDTRNWWPGKRVLVAPSRIETIDGHNRTLHLGLSRDSIEHSPEYKVSMSQEEPHEMTTGCSL